MLRFQRNQIKKLDLEKIEIIRQHIMQNIICPINKPKPKSLHQGFFYRNCFTYENEVLNSVFKKSLRLIKKRRQDG